MSDMSICERVARAICGATCRLRSERGWHCPDGEPCQATFEQIFLSKMYSEAQAAIAAITRDERGDT